MKTFLREVAEDIIKSHQDLQPLVFVLPSKRAGVFLRNELLSLTTKTGFGPKIYSIEEFVQELSRLRLADTTELLFEFYQVYKALTPQEATEDFYSFSRWATTMIQDFNEIDRYLIATDDFFNYLASIKELSHWYLQEEKTSLQQNYIRFWNTLHQYYTQLKTRLLEKQLGYQGLIYREAVENLNYYLQVHQSKPHFFIGFNALNTAESLIIQEFLSHTNTKVFWDIDAHFVEDKQHDAGLFVRRYFKDWQYYQKNPFTLFGTYFSEKKQIEITGIPKNIGQAHYISKLLSALKERKQGLQNTAIVLGNEILLAPLLNALPKDITEVNITGGYPLYLSPIASFFSNWFELLDSKETQGWYHRPLINLLSHPAGRLLFTSEDKDYATQFIDKINTQNQLYLSQENIVDHFPQNLHPICDVVFSSRSTSDMNTVITNCLHITLTLKEKYQDQGGQALYLEYLYRLYRIFNQLQHLNKEYQVIEHLKGFRHLFKELLSKETIDFQGKPLQGLQIMGVLESRNLDFETVIITSLNEGILPSGKSDNSFIPFDMKSAFDLPTYKEKDAIYTYHFYHLLQRAKNVYLLYNSEPDVLEGGEKSRFLLQLTLDKVPAHTITEHIAGPQVTLAPPKLTKITKNEALNKRLEEIATRGFSPTNLTNYIRNPLDFYLQSVVGIRNEVELEETVAANTLGTVVHDTLEDLYTPMVGKLLTGEALANAHKLITPTVEKNFTKTYRGGDISRGKNLIIYHVALQYVTKFIEMEQKEVSKGASIKILKLESDLKQSVPIPQLDFPVFLRGKADRIDEKDGIIRIIDYKTGKVLQNELELYDWDVLTTDYKYSKAFQVLAYAYMLKDEFPTKEVQAGIISFKNYGGGFLRFATKDSPRSAKKAYAVTTTTLEAFLKELTKLVLEICNSTQPFIEKEI
ncbi:PD-(D/E)XK nuclease family protein [Ascidiimonas sp. W6]|uniref:PD-(D/E)XK nuclease family protein n=1 Tax=Ascidiimonas meishanensis TaxID=3128903 RepID=UPI0030EDE66C